MYVCFVCVGLMWCGLYRGGSAYCGGRWVGTLI